MSRGNQDILFKQRRRPENDITIFTTCDNHELQNFTKLAYKEPSDGQTLFFKRNVTGREMEGEEEEEPFPHSPWFPPSLRWTIQGCTKRLFPGFVKLGEKVAFCLPNAGRRTQFFHLIFTQPGKSLLVQPCTLHSSTD